MRGYSRVSGTRRAEKLVCWCERLQSIHDDSLSVSLEDVLNVYHGLVANSLACLARRSRENARCPLVPDSQRAFWEYREFVVSYWRYFEIRSQALL